MARVRAIVRIMCRVSVGVRVVVNTFTARVGVAVGPLQLANPNPYPNPKP